jgi:hypothetical protein
LLRFRITLIATVVCSLLVVPPAAGKEGVSARLDKPVRLEAASGATVRIAWTLTYRDGGANRPFGAGGVFVRLSSASGAAPTKAHGSGPAGHYVAEVTVPEGGIGGIRFGLEGTRYVGGPPGEGRAEDADVYFPLLNDPFDAGDVGSSRTSESSPQTADTNQEPSIWLVVVGALGAAGLLLTVRRITLRRRLRQGLG